MEFQIQLTKDKTKWWQNLEFFDRIKKKKYLVPVDELCKDYDLFNPKQHCDGNLHNSISGPFRPGML